MPTKTRKVTLYVKSVKTLIERKLESGFRFLGKIRVSYPAHYEKIVGDYEFVLPEDQKKFVGIFKEAVNKIGFDIQIVDVGRENVLRRQIQKEIKKIRTFPTFVTDSGEKVEGKIPKERIIAILSKQKA